MPDRAHLACETKRALTSQEGGVYNTYCCGRMVQRTGARAFIWEKVGLEFTRD